MVMACEVGNVNGKNGVFLRDCNKIYYVSWVRVGLGCSNY